MPDTAVITENIRRTYQAGLRQEQDQDIQIIIIDLLHASDHKHPAPWNKIILLLFEPGNNHLVEQNISHLCQSKPHFTEFNRSQHPSQLDARIHKLKKLFLGQMINITLKLDHIRRKIRLYYPKWKEIQIKISRP